jgi:hypothetical protein
METKLIERHTEAAATRKRTAKEKSTTSSLGILWEDVPL